MWPFKKREPVDSKPVPKEVQKYYQSEHRDRVGLAWLIAFLSLIITVVIIVGLFVGGRWVYHKVRGTNTASTTQPQTQSGSNPTAETQPNSQPQSTSSPSQHATSSTSTNVPNSSTAPGSTTQSSQPASSTTTQTTTGSTSTQVTNTGPGNVVAIFVSVSIVGALAHNAYLKRKLNKV